MKPRLAAKYDQIESLLDQSWEGIPAHLEEKLLETPVHLKAIQASRYDKISLVLNAVLAVWTLGLIFTFKELISSGLLKLSGQNHL